MTVAGLSPSIFPKKPAFFMIPAFGNDNPKMIRRDNRKLSYLSSFCYSIYYLGGG